MVGNAVACDVGVGKVGVGVIVGGGEVGVKVTGRRGSNVMVGTGDKRAACKVLIRSCALPVAGISVIICLSIFSLMGGIGFSGSWL